MNRSFLFIGTLSLLAGFLIYICFRSATLLYFNWIDAIEIKDMVFVLHEITLPFKSNLPDWVLYSLPDGLWLFSYMCFLLCFWENTLNKRNMFWFLIVPVFAVMQEFGQLTGYVPGTFDPMDLLFFMVGAGVPLLISINLKFKKNEITV